MSGEARKRKHFILVNIEVIIQTYSKDKLGTQLELQKSMYVSIEHGKILLPKNSGF